ncbi:hypothetical protein ABIF29_005696 [Bradyrhizobium elkanii]|uniref:Uncharacterized protein n=1 Tax=Bradyrhizobium elkanii TaxID=29448 RepID=A0ABV4F623_BRAEL
MQALMRAAGDDAIIDEVGIEQRRQGLAAEIDVMLDAAKQRELIVVRQQQEASEHGGGPARRDRGIGIGLQSVAWCQLAGARNIGQRSGLHLGRQRQLGGRALIALAQHVTVAIIPRRSFPGTAQLLQQGDVADQHALDVRRDDAIRDQALRGVVIGDVVEGIVKRQQIGAVQADADALAIENSSQRFLHACGIAEIDQDQIGAAVEIPDMRAKVGE